MRLKPAFAALFLSLIIGLAVGCEHDPEEMATESGSDCPTGTVSFATEIAPLVKTNCGIPSCHVPGGNGNGTYVSGPDATVDYAEVKAKVDNGSFNDRVLVQKDMPQGGSLTDCEKNRISEWLNAGAPNN